MFIRKFIIMSKQTLEDVKGHVRLEVREAKGKLSFSVEGVSPKEDTAHTLYALTDEEEFKEVNLGPVSINNSGRGKLDLRFNSKSVNQSKIDINGFNMLVLREENLASGDKNVLLAGYIHRDDGSISKLNEEIKQDDKKKPLEKLDEPEKEEQVEKILKGKSLEKSEKKIETMEELMKEDLKEKKQEPVVPNTLDLLKSFKEVKPFKEEVQNESFKWWEIDDDELNNEKSFLPYYKYISDPACKEQIDKYNKYLFGVAEDDGRITHYIYGIPGRHQRNEHPHGGKTGFVTWLEDKSEERNGYWLIYIDSKKGNVVRPS